MAQATIATTVTGLQGRPVATTAPTNNQALAWNGSAWTPLGPYLPLTGGTLTGNIVTSGNIQTTGGTFQSNLSTGQYLNTSGVNIVSGRAVNGVNLASTAIAFGTPSTYLGYGVNGNAITPVTSGRVLVLYRFNMWAASGSSCSCASYYGTGTAPNAGSTTAVGNVFATGAGNGNTNGTVLSFEMTNVAAISTGTKYWFDLFASSAGGGLGYQQFTSCQLIEI